MVFIAVDVQIMVFWDVTTCSLVGNIATGLKVTTCHIYLAALSPHALPFSKMDVTYYSETLVSTCNTIW
jgi:hypothetical protein